MNKAVASLHDRVEFALRDAGFNYDEASRIAALTDEPAPTADGGAVAYELTWPDTDSTSLIYPDEVTDPMRPHARPLVYGDTHPAPAPDVALVPDSVIVLLNHLETLMDEGKLAEDAIPVAMWNEVSMHNLKVTATKQGATNEGVIPEENKYGQE